MDLVQANNTQNTIRTAITINIHCNKEASHPEHENPKPRKTLFNHPTFVLPLRSLFAFATRFMWSNCSLRFWVMFGMWIQPLSLPKFKYPHAPFSCTDDKSHVGLFCNAVFDVARSCTFNSSNPPRVALANASLCLVRLYNIIRFLNAVI